ncbi:inactive serine/threonine-protein kinase TEX14-like isoform X2 [Vespula squamosa]|uniref:Inactive serine/threonine-protein kinase TEX14-like isoform X2 n=1 Tax=Vespula squamosa TaxID=30214 RepID=A0ABD2AJK5_VESSQ
MDRRRFSTTMLDAPSQNSLDIKGVSLLTDNGNDDEDDNDNDNEQKTIQEGNNAILLLDVPNVTASEIFEIGSVAGTEDRYLELIYAEWENTRISLKRQTHPECRNAVKTDMEILTKIRHPNIVMLMAMTHTEDYGLVSILEPVDCTLYNYMHEQGERISVREMARFAGKLADALRHAHMRGYVHSAISSHCVYLAFGETVKLAGWELAINLINPKPKQEYEDILRGEIFRWQAPELFSGISCKESDVYGLALLIWEMCTMRVPWIGCDIPEIKKQYLELKHGVPIDLCSSIPLVNSLLEIALQIDIAKRNIDINKIRRLLQSLEIQYEHKDPVYMDECKKEKKEINKRIVTSVTEASIATNCHKIPSPTTLTEECLDLSKNTKCLYSTKSDSVKTKQCLDPTRTKVRTCDSEVLADAPSPNVNTLIQNDLSNLYNNHKENKLHSPGRENREIKKKSNNVDSGTSKLQSFNTFRKSQQMKKSMTLNNVYRKMRIPKNLSESNNSSISPSLPGVTDLVEDIPVDVNARINLQRLKELLANRRERFFNDIGSPQLFGQSESLRSSVTETELLSKVKSKDYEPHKPASHKTCLEPKFNKSPGSYDSSYVSPNQTARKQPYSQMPTNIKNAIMQPRVLIPDPRSFFESSLWKKEKEICISKMRKEDKSDMQTSEESPENMYTKLGIMKRSETYNINDKSEKNKQNNRVLIENVPEPEQIVNNKNNSLQVLKDALDRATEIICSTSTHKDAIVSCLPSQSYNNIHTTTNKTYINKPIIDKAYDLTYTDDIEDVKNKKEMDYMYGPSLLSKNVPIDTETLENSVYDTKIDSNDFTFSREHDECESIIHHLKNPIHNSETIQLNNKEVSNEIYSKELFQPVSINEKHDYELPFLSTLDNSCKKCNNKISLQRRRSLPATFPHPKIGSNSQLGKLPIRKADHSINNSIEDFYIDDDNLELMNLNINMLLLDDEMFYDNYLFDKQTT